MSRGDFTKEVERRAEVAAMKIVNHVCETHNVHWTERQDHNDELFEFVKIEIESQVKQAVRGVCVHRNKNK